MEADTLRAGSIAHVVKSCLENCWSWEIYTKPAWFGAAVATLAPGGSGDLIQLLRRYGGKLKAAVI
jgi:hypothetical protein